MNEFRVNVHQKLLAYACSVHQRTQFCGQPLQAQTHLGVNRHIIFHLYFKMTQEVHTTFSALSHAQFNAHANAMISNSKTAATKRQAIAYLSHIVSADKKTLDTDRKALQTKRYAQQRRENKVADLHSELEFDFSKTPTLFTAQQQSDADMLSALAVNHAHVFIGGKTYAGDITVSGNDVTLNGEGHGFAIGETLVNSAQITGTLHIAGSNCVIKNVDFTSTGNKAVTVAGSTNLVIDSCKFTCFQNINDSKWFYGAGLGAGTLTIKNCIVTGFNSWYLADASTGSSAATVKLDEVNLIDNYFKNNHGSIAIRGPTATPNGKVHVLRNKFETDTFHSQFWDFVEVSGGVREVWCTDNEFIGVAGTHTEVGKKGAVQVWSQSAVPWTLYFKNNKCSNVKVVLKIAHNSSFYSPNTHDPSQHIEFDATLADVAYCFSPVYKKGDGSTADDDKWQEGDYVPINAAQYPSVPAIINPHNYAVVQKSN
jgi:hypothetical protein